MVRTSAPKEGRCLSNIKRSTTIKRPQNTELESEILKIEPYYGLLDHISCYKSKIIQRFTLQKFMRASMPSKDTILHYPDCSTK